MFITFEGSEGSGKSTQIDLLAEYLELKGHKVIVTREPGGTPIGEQIRSCLHDVNNKDMSAVTEILLYSASRAQLVEEIILPALKDEAIVLSDRYSDSTIAYQGYGRGLDLDALRKITKFATRDLKPDISLLLEIDVAKGLERREIGGQEINRMDLQTFGFYERVRKGYEALVAADPDRWIVVDANKSESDLQVEIRRLVEDRLSGS